MAESRFTPRSLLTLPVLAVLALFLGACSTTTEDGSPSESAPGLDMDVIGTGFEGDFEPPPSTGPAAQSGAEVWYISCGQAYEACSHEASHFEEASAALGWNVTVLDGKADPNTAAALIRQGVAAQVDGIALVTYDCPSIKAALLEARDAGVPVVNFGSIDCDDEAFGSEEKLFAASVNVRGSDDQGKLWQDQGEARARYAVAALGGEPGPIISINETSQLGQQYQSIGFTKGIEELCPDCEIIDVPFTFSQVPTKSSEIFKAALASNPEVDVVGFAPDALVGLGLSTVFAQSGQADLIKAGSEGLPSNFELIRNGDQTSSTYLPYDWYSWALADTLNRILAGETDLPSEGGGYMFIDGEHNTPAGDDVELPIDFRADYEAVWEG